MKYIKENNNLFDWRIIVLATLVSILNSFFYDNFIIMNFVLIIQVLILAKCFVLGQDIKYLSYYIIFLSTSMESPSFVGTNVFYGFKNSKIAGISICIVCIMPLLIKYIYQGKVFNLHRGKGSTQKFIKLVYVTTLLGLVMGLLSILFNNNSIADKMNGISMFVDACYIFIFVAIEIIVIVSIIKYNSQQVYLIKQTLVAISISLAITLVMCLILKNYGNRGGLNSLQVSSIVMLLICVILLPFYNVFSYKQKLLLSISGATITILALLYNTNGKMIIITALIPIAVIILLVRSRKPIKAIIIGVIMSIIVFISINMIVPMMEQYSPLFLTKMEQAIAMLKFWENDWLINLPESPKMRISQTLNISAEYIQKPWLAFIGKGYMGTIKDHLQIFGSVNEFSFSTWELNNQLYYLMHESFNTLFLTNGMLGIYFFLDTLKTIVKKFHLSPWLLIGGIWFILFYAYSITISIYGVTALLIGLYDIDLLVQKTNKNKFNTGVSL